MLEVSEIQFEIFFSAICVSIFTFDLSSQRDGASSINLTKKFLLSSQTDFSRGLKYLGCALISAQKIFLFLGDLARYREQINPPKQNNFGKAKQYYMKAQQIVPRNGRPYNQLALLSVYSVSVSDGDFLNL